jgi:hypothetical protein
MYKKIVKWYTIIEERIYGVLTRDEHRYTNLTPESRIWARSVDRVRRHEVRMKRMSSILNIK